MLYRGLARIDASFGASSWAEALAWLAAIEPSRPIAQVQYWGHGRWGRVLIGDDPLDEDTLRPGHALAPAIAQLRARLLPDGLFWLRTCEAFGARAGHAFAERLAGSLGVRVAGHTFVIAALQSGLRALAPGRRPAWDAAEGLAEGTPERPIRAHGSWPSHPRTVTLMTNAIPDAWFDEDGA